jgi:hypothetical protein
MTDAQEIQATDATQATQDLEGAQDTHAEPNLSEPAPTEPADIAPSLAALIAAIRAAVTRTATAEARAGGAIACRSLLTVLDAKPGQPLGAAPQPAGSPSSPIASLFSQPGFLSKLAAMSRDQLLDLVKQITGAQPARTASPTSAGPRFHLIQLPQARRPDGR